MGHEGAFARSALRFSLGRDATDAEVAAALEVWNRVLPRLGRR